VRIALFPGCGDVDPHPVRFSQPRRSEPLVAGLDAPTRHGGELRNEGDDGTNRTLDGAVATTSGRICCHGNGYGGVLSPDGRTVVALM